MQASSARSPQLSAWLPALGVMAVAGVYSILIGYGAHQINASRISLLLFALPFVVALGLVLIRYFQLAVLLLPFVVMLVQAGIPTGTLSLVPVSMAMALVLTGLWCISLLLRGWQMAPSRMNVPLIMFLGVCGVSLIWGIVWRDPVVETPRRFIFVQLAALAAIVASVGAALLIGNFVRSERHLKLIFGAFIVTGIINAVVRLAGAELPTFLVEKGLWSLWLIAPVFGLLIAQPGMGWYWRLALAGVIALTIYQTAAVDYLWLSGWVPMVIAMATIAALHRPRAIPVVAALLAVVILFSAPFLQRVIDDNIQEGALSRLDLWAQNLRVVQDRWLLGTGPSGYTIYYRALFPFDLRSTHNGYMDILGQFGVVGILAWGWVMIASLREGWDLSRRAPSGFLRTLAIVATGGWVAALASMMLGDWVLPYTYNQTIYGFRYTVYSWIFLGMLISVRSILDARERARPAEVRL